MYLFRLYFYNVVGNKYIKIYLYMLQFEYQKITLQERRKKTMEREKMIKILMLDGSTEKEAIKHIENGTCIYDLSEKEVFVDNYIACLNYSDLDYSEAVKKAGNDFDSLPQVVYNDCLYFIDYVL